MKFLTRPAWLLVACLAIFAPAVHAARGHWTTGWPAAEPVQASAAPSDPSVVYAASQEGLWKSTDSGRSWGHLPLTLAIYSLAVDPSDSDTLYVAEALSNRYPLIQISKSSDGGENWQPVLQPGAFSGFSSLQVQQDEHRSIWAMEYDCQPPALVCNASLIRSEDGGLNWASVGRRGVANTLGYRIDSFALDPSNEDVVYLIDGEGFFKSPDRGTTWARLGALPGSGRDGVLAVDPFNPGVLYAGSEPFQVGGASGFSRSTDGGTTWETTLDGYISAILADPRRAGTVWIGTDAGILVSSDFGATWSGVTPPLDVGIDSLSLGGNVLHAGTAVGVFELTTIPADAVPHASPTPILAPASPARLEGLARRMR